MSERVYTCIKNSNNTKKIVHTIRTTSLSYSGCATSSLIQNVVFISENTEFILFLLLGILEQLEAVSEKTFQYIISQMKKNGISYNEMTHLKPHFSKMLSTLPW